MQRLTRALGALALLLGVLNCSVTTDPDDELEAELRRAEARWQLAAVQDYQVVVRNLCFCGYTRPVLFTVRLGNVVSRVDAETGEPVPSYGDSVRNIPALFELIRDAIVRDAYSLSVIYDAQYGYPLQINIDYIGNAVDDELQVTVSGFQPMR